MAFEAIEFVGAPVKASVPAGGVRVSSRGAAPRGGALVRFIQIKFGSKLAEQLCLKLEQVGLSVQFGSGRDAGKIAFSVDASTGAFLAKRDKNGGYSFTINARTADGLFALDFPPFVVEKPEILTLMGKPPIAVFACSEAMLAAGDD